MTNATENPVRGSVWRDRTAGRLIRIEEVAISRVLVSHTSSVTGKPLDVMWLSLRTLHQLYEPV